MTLEHLKAFLGFAQQRGLHLTMHEIGITGEPVKGWNGETETPSISWERAEHLISNPSAIEGAITILGDLLEWQKDPNPFEQWRALAEEFFKDHPDAPSAPLFGWAVPGLFRDEDDDD